ncbi:MAG TPA: O-antigen ligase family protein, partial [Vicinamibacteria bacterium]|nr:O-antigen ligase family protein [Vicinamibacteria bacterium]
AEWWRPAAARVDAPPAAAAAGASEDMTRPFWAMMVFTCVLLVAPQTFVPGLSALRVALLTVVVAVAGYVHHQLSRGRPLNIWPREMKLTLWLVAWAFLTIPLSMWPGGSWALLTDLYLKTLVIFWLLTNTVNTPTRLRQVAWGLTLMTVPAALSGVKNYASGVYMQYGAGRIRGYDAGPMTGNPNDLALTLNLVLPLTVALLFLTKRPLWRALLVGIIMLDLIAIVLTFSRGGFLTLALSAGIVLWRITRRVGPKYAFMAVGLLLVLAPLVPSSYYARLATITDVESDDTKSSEVRQQDIVVAMGYIARHPLVGSGIGNNTLALNNERGASWAAVHNSYLQVGMELGLPGLALYVALVVSTLKTVGRVVRGTRGDPAHTELFWLASGLQISLIAFAFAAMLHPAAYNFYF